jgi:hypothetical protein
MPYLIGLLIIALVAWFGWQIYWIEAMYRKAAREIYEPWEKHLAQPEYHPKHEAYLSRAQRRCSTRPSSGACSKRTIAYDLPLRRPVPVPHLPRPSNRSHY